jgi:hypothetical protein
MSLAPLNSSRRNTVDCNTGEVGWVMQDGGGRGGVCVIKRVGWWWWWGVYLSIYCHISVGSYIPVACSMPGCVYTS